MLELTKFICLILIVTLFDSSYGKQFRFDYEYVKNAEGWFKLHEIPATWKDARLKCFREGATLASPENQNILSGMTKMLSFNKIQSCGIFTGIHATFSKGDYFSLGGTPISKIPISWAPGEPDNFENGENCLLMLHNGTMADTKCTDVYPFVCYKKKTKNVLSGCGTHDAEYVLEPRTGSCYKFHRSPQSWSRAFAACSGEGGHLAIINSDIEAQVIAEIFARSPDNTIPGVYNKDIAHMGFNDWGERGLWLTIHDQTLAEAGYSKWAAGQPDNATNGEFCGGVFRDGTLDDIWCDKSYPFICEKSPDSLIPEDDKR